MSTFHLPTQLWHSVCRSVTRTGRLTCNLSGGFVALTCHFYDLILYFWKLEALIQQCKEETAIYGVVYLSCKFACLTWPSILANVMLEVNLSTLHLDLINTLLLYCTWPSLINYQPAIFIFLTKSSHFRRADFRVVIKGVLVEVTFCLTFIDHKGPMWCFLCGCTIHLFSQPSFISSFCVTQHVPDCGREGIMSTPAVSAVIRKRQASMLNYSLCVANGSCIWRFGYFFLFFFVNSRDNR